MNALPPRAQRSIAKLASVMGEDVLLLDIHVVDDKVAPNDAPAWTTDAGVFLLRSVVENEPQNIGVYVGHEILHHVVEDPLASATFPHAITNVAEDFVINYLLKVVYRLNVLKVGVPGVYDRRLGSKTVFEVCAKLTKNHSRLRGCGCASQKITHPLLARIAAKIRADLETHPAAMQLKLGQHRQVVILEREDDEALFNQLKAEFWKFGKVKQTRLDLNLLVRALFARLYTRTVRYDVRKDMPRLSHTHNIALSIATQKLRPYTVGDAGASLAFTFHLVKYLLDYGTERWKTKICSRQRHRIELLKRKLKERNFYSKTERRKFAASIERAIAKIEKTEKEVSLEQVLTASKRVKVKGRSDKTGAALVDAVTVRDDHLPRFKRNDLSHFVKRVARRANKELRDQYLIRDRLQEYIKSSKTSRVKSVLESDKRDDANLSEQLERMERQTLPKIRRRIARPSPEQLEKMEQAADKAQAKRDRLREKEDRKIERERKREDRQAARDEKLLRKELIEDGQSPEEIEEQIAEARATKEAERKKQDEDRQAARAAEDQETYRRSDEAREENDDEETDEDRNERDSDSGSSSGESEQVHESEFGDDPGDDDSEEDEDADPQINGADGAARKGQGQGDGEGQTHASMSMSTLEMIGRNPKMLRKILIEADVFAEKMAQVSRSKIDPNTQVDRTYTFGDEVGRADTSALVKLANDSMRMSFFADIANHALLQHTGTSPRRGSIILCLDCSGSMQGEPFTIAAGFALAMFKIMSETKRGCALVKFATNVDGMYVVDERMPVDMMQLLEALLTPSFGGTEFDAALEQAIALQETFNWKNTQCLLVTDGGGWVSKPIVDVAHTKMKLASVLVGYGKSAIPNISDNRVVRSLEDLRNGLIHVAQSVL